VLSGKEMYLRFEEGEMLNTTNTNPGNLLVRQPETYSRTCEFYVHGYLWKRINIPVHHIRSGRPWRVAILPETSPIQPPCCRIRVIRFKGHKLLPVPDYSDRVEVPEVLFYPKEIEEKDDNLGYFRRFFYFCDDPRVAIGEGGRLFLK